MLNDAVQELGELIELKEQLEAEVAIEHAEELAEIKRKEAQLRALQVEIEEAQQDMQSETLDELREVSEDIANLMTKIRETAHALPIEDLSGSRAIISGKARVRISKVEPSITFDAQGMLKADPELLEARLEGKPAFQYSISPGAVERLILGGRLDRKWAEKYRRLSKPRAPSVTIEILQTEIGEES